MTGYRNRYLTGSRLRIFLAAADCIIPPEGEGPGGGTSATAGAADWALAGMASPLRRKLLLFLHVIQLLGFAFGGRPFTRNSRSDQCRQLSWMENGPVPAFRMGFFGLKSYVCMGYYTREEIWATIGYGGPMEPNRPFPDPSIRLLCRGVTR